MLQAAQQQQQPDKAGVKGTKKPGKAAEKAALKGKRKREAEAEASGSTPKRPAPRKVLPCTAALCLVHSV